MPRIEHTTQKKTNKTTAAPKVEGRPMKTAPSKAPAKTKRSGALQAIVDVFKADAAEVQAQYEDFLRNERETHEKLSAQDQVKRAERRTYLAFKRRRNSGNIEVTGVCINASDTIDFMAKKRRQAEELFRKNPRVAMAKGITDADGTPLDTQKTFKSGKKNPKYGKPLPAAQNRRIYNWLATWTGTKDGAEDQDEPTLMTVFANAQGSPPPMFKRCSFRASNIQASKDDAPGIINVSDEVTYDEAEDGDVDVGEMITQFAKHLRCDITELSDHIQQFGERNTVVIEGDVVRMTLHPDEGRSRSLIVEDDSIGGDDRGCSVWLSEHVEVDFDEGSRVIIIGQAREGSDPSFGIAINSGGVWAIPEYKVPLIVPDETFDEEDFDGDEYESPAPKKTKSSFKKSKAAPDEEEGLEDIDDVDAEEENEEA